MLGWGPRLLDLKRFKLKPSNPEAWSLGYKMKEFELGLDELAPSALMVKQLTPRVLQKSDLGVGCHRALGATVFRMCWCTRKCVLLTHSHSGTSGCQVRFSEQVIL